MLEEIKGISFSGLSDDSRLVKKGDIFFAVPGANFDGAKFISEAVRKGAVAVVAGKDTPAGSVSGVRLIHVDDPRAALAMCASDFYNKPSGKVKVIGITGTNGKTTISHMLAAIFKKAGYEAGIVGTISHRWKNNNIQAHNTTPGALELQRLLGMMANDNVRYCAMEVSSHSLDQERVGGIDFHSALFTNITGDHLDYHKTFDNYIQAKSKLFRALKPGRAAILNADDPNACLMAKGAAAKIINYGIRNDAHIRASAIRLAPDKTEFLLKTKTDLFKITSPLIGMFNVYNILAACACALQENIPVTALKAALLDFRGAQGRLDAVSSGKDFQVFIDYAHTDDALKNVLEALREVTTGRLIVVFGCGGDRDRSKRPRMGKVAAELADYLIITSDNPRSEDPLEIATEIKNGLPKGFRNYRMILDRSEAIGAALGMAGKGDTVLLAGKGHEKYQFVGNKALPFSDRAAVVEIISNSKRRQPAKCLA